MLSLVFRKIKNWQFSTHFDKKFTKELVLLWRPKNAVFARSLLPEIHSGNVPVDFFRRCNNRTRLIWPQWDPDPKGLKRFEFWQLLKKSNLKPFWGWDLFWSQIALDWAQPGPMVRASPDARKIAPGSQDLISESPYLVDMFSKLRECWLTAFASLKWSRECKESVEYLDFMPA